MTLQVSRTQKRRERSKLWALELVQVVARQGSEGSIDIF